MATLEELLNGFRIEDVRTVTARCYAQAINEKASNIGEDTIEAVMSEMGRLGSERQRPIIEHLIAEFKAGMPLPMDFISVIE